MNQQISIERAGQRFILCKEKVVFWQEQKALLLSDLHAGKAALFRANGIPLSSDHLLQDLLNLEVLIDRFGAEHLYILGDLFHSDYNEENGLVMDWLSKINAKTLLIEGNHDLHSSNHYTLDKVPELSQDQLLLVHEPQESKGDFQINGHLHPAYRIKAKARQSFRLPCFFLNNERLVLPAFGQLTGSKSLKKKKGDQVIVIAPEGLMVL